MRIVDDMHPLIRSPPPYKDIDSCSYTSEKAPDFDQPPPYPSPNESSNNRFRIPQGCDLCWSSLYAYGPSTTASSFSEKYARRRPQKRKEILHKVSGIAKAGRLLAIMGSSGAGKTTLLNVLTSRNLAGLDVEGKITVDGQSISKWKFKEISAFVQQHDMFVGTMTAREHLRFMARLRIGSNYTKMEQDLRVEEVIRKMGLSGCADTLIGTPSSSKGLSCGEMKRLAFASEMLTCPKILFCDEPTSGLDAFMAGHVVSALRTLADGGMTVIITIHQPSSQVYNSFNDVCLMACGRIIYLGPTEEAHPLFERCGYPSPDYCNPADHLVRTLAIINDRKKDCLETISKIRKGFLETAYGKRIREIEGDKSMEKRVFDGSDAMNHNFFTMKHPASFYAQLSALTWRAWLTIVRDPTVLKIKLIQTIICAIITGLIYLQTPIRPDTIMSINGVLFNLIRDTSFMLQYPAVPAMTMELPIVLRENANGIYSTSAYFLGKNIAEFPQYVILPAIYTAIVYWMAGLVPDIWTFLFATFICILMINVAISISYATATVFGSTDIAMTILPMFIVPMLAFGGFFITFETIPGYFKWFSKLSYFKYSYEALAINEWEMIDFIPGCVNYTLQHSSCPSTGREVLEQIDFNEYSKWVDVLILTAMFFIIRAISYVALLVRAYRNH
ncbi:unnamed protein product [Cylicocyclus nassatus]|uniref:ABC transporter domain-containing protein n=1 Tax=Cylicocyclus nassatus TaxID=53992 RepID=A0AA36GXE0_CYLNA|nr:unnamed protein product [Cylicocyclus nassatus]